MKKPSEDTRSFLALAAGFIVFAVIIYVVHLIALAIGAAYDGSVGITPRWEMSDTRRRMTLLLFLLIGCLMWAIALIPAVLTYRLVQKKLS